MPIENVYCEFCGDMIWEEYFQPGPYGGKDTKCVKSCVFLGNNKFVCEECIRQNPYYGSFEDIKNRIIWRY